MLESRSEFSAIAASDENRAQVCAVSRALSSTISAYYRMDKRLSNLPKSKLVFACGSWSIRVAMDYAAGGERRHSCVAMESNENYRRWLDFRTTSLGAIQIFLGRTVFFEAICSSKISADFLPISRVP